MENIESSDNMSVIIWIEIEIVLRVGWSFKKATLHWGTLYDQIGNEILLRFVKTEFLSFIFFAASIWPCCLC